MEFNFKLVAILIEAYGSNGQCLFLNFWSTFFVPGMWLAHLITFWGLLPSLWAVLRSGRVLFRWIWSQLQNKLSSWKNDACADGAGVQEGWDEPEQEHGDDLWANPEGARAWCPNWIDWLNKEPLKKRKGFILSKVEKLFIYCWSMLDAVAKTVLTNWLQSFWNNFSVQHQYQPHHHHPQHHHHDRQVRWAKDNRRHIKGHRFEGLGQWGGVTQNCLNILIISIPWKQKSPPGSQQCIVFLEQFLVNCVRALPWNLVQ